MLWQTQMRTSIIREDLHIKNISEAIPNAWKRNRSNSEMHESANEDVKATSDRGVKVISRADESIISRPMNSSGARLCGKIIVSDPLSSRCVNSPLRLISPLVSDRFHPAAHLRSSACLSAPRSAIHHYNSFPLAPGENARDDPLYRSLGSWK